VDLFIRELADDPAGAGEQHDHEQREPLRLVERGEE